MSKVSVFITTFLMFGSSLSAQNDLPRVTIRGEVVRAGGSIPDGLRVELRSLTNARPPFRIPVTYDGSFEYRNVEIGEYELEITDRAGDVIHEDFIKVRETGTRFVVYLPERRRELPSGPNVISVQKLLHPVPSKAAEEFARSSDASSAGDLKKSIQHLEKAVRIYPDYLEAHNNLGVAYMRLNQFDKAAAEFGKAIALDPTSDKVHLNLGLTLLALGRLSEAEVSARKAVELAPRSVAAHYALGQVLFGQQKMTDEALDTLRKTEEQFPLARLLVAHILLVRRAIPDATAELQAYLASGHPDKRQDVQAWLELLARAPKPQ
jgi:tetratricopeptide (TPR) repeat protein